MIEHLDGIFLILFGLISAIRFRYNGRTSLRGSMKLDRLLFGNKHKVSKFQISFSQYAYLIGGIIFIILGLLKIFNVI